MRGAARPPRPGRARESGRRGARRPAPSGPAQHARRVGVGLAAAGAATAAGLLYRRHTTPFPYLPWALEKELPFLDRRRLVEILEPRPGERILEIGPGTGLFSLPVARALGPTGRLDVFDIQQVMLDHTLTAAGERGIANVSATRGDARELPFASGSFDGAFMVTVLGEIHGWDRALGELRRVLRPGGRLVVGEFLLDWHAVPLALLRRRAGAVGLRLERRSGPFVSYLARLSAV